MGNPKVRKKRPGGDEYNFNFIARIIGIAISLLIKE